MDYISIHKKWDKFWETCQTNKFNPKSGKPKYYCLEMFAYPSGANLHLGHYFNYGPSDTHARFKRMMGFEVFQPMGFDAFGLPAENHALKTGTHPQDNTFKNMDKMVSQLKSLGGMYDWDYTLNTCFPDYYKWTQWLFIQLYKAGLAYQKNAPVNWCEKCKTVLANEQASGGVCERCGSTVHRKQMNQWFFKITDFAEELLAGLDNIDWPNKTKIMQRNWIGKSTGSRVRFEAITQSGAKEPLDVFTTRTDTLFGVTFMTVAPEHPLVEKLISKQQSTECKKYIAQAAKKSEIERLGSDTEKTGVFTGSYATNPINGASVPIYIGDYVLATYGTGAVMAVPAHDDRDFAFAKKYNLPIQQVIAADKTKPNEIKIPYNEDGFLVNSDKFSGLTSEDARKKITEHLKKQNKGEPQINYRLRDWGIGRQRYWGCPIPIIYCDKCGITTVPEDQLPVELPYITDFSPKGAAPLASHPEFVNCKCPHCGGTARRECETMDTFVDSSWYFLRYPDAKNDKEPFNKKIMEKMLPVDKYIGGAEHACMHLLYARFITMFLKKQGYINFSEPFTCLVHQGMILAGDGSKMSKSKGNTKTPDEYTSQYGSDILRLFMLFGFNYIEGGPWNDNTLKTVTRFTERIENVIKNAGNKSADRELLYVMNNTIKSVREDLEKFSFNTAVARCMELLNAIGSQDAPRDVVKTLVLLVAPMIPHIAEEYWEMLGEKPSIFDVPFPNYDDRYLVRDTVEIVVQINSKIIGRMNVANDAEQSDVEKKCADMIAGKSVKKVVYIKNRLINFIAS